MFSHLFTVAHYLDKYDKGEYSGIHLDLGTGGLYYEQSYGPNWWGYYFEPLEVGVKEGHPIENSSKETDYHFAYAADLNLPRQRVAELVQKYIRVKPQIQQKVDDFVKSDFEDHFVIGIHYRGTDKYTEAPLIPYERVAESINHYVKENQIDDYIIFVATDEQRFVDYMKQAFPDQIVSLNHFRSTNGQPIHFVKPSPYLQGQETVIDCLLLARCHTLFRTSSNLGAWSTFFNPTIPVTPLSLRH
jgi:hypothetical protein